MFAQEMLVAKDNVIVDHTFEEIQVLVDKFESAPRSFCLTINIKKTECFHKPTKLMVPLPPMLFYIRINVENIVQFKNFSY